MRIGLSALSFSYRCGLVGQGTPRAVASPLSADALITLAVRAGLTSLALPAALLPALGTPQLPTLRDRLLSCGLKLVVDAEIIGQVDLAGTMRTAAALGASTVRVLASPVLEGLRATFTNDWEAHLATVSAILRDLAPLATEYGVVLAVENHQDLTADDLLTIMAAVDSPAVGVTFDPVNALVVAEDPFTALDQLGPYIRNIHLSDYLAYPSNEGWRLVRCALGEGDLNLRRMLVMLAALAPDATCQIELVSHSSRHVRLLTDAWWQGYPPRDVRQIIPVLRELAAHARSRDDDWRSPWERGAAPDQIAQYEDRQFAASLNYLRALGAIPGA
ncbi:MAG: sugar phosphate isomerase/epimerase family protein [Oscillochloridaceae bacterium umkhey_bin13]